MMATGLRDRRPAVLHRAFATTAFTAPLAVVSKKTRNIEFLVDAQTTFSGFCRTLLEEKAGRGMNRFQVKKDGTADFDAVWLGRDTPPAACGWVP